MVAQGSECRIIYVMDDCSCYKTMACHALALQVAGEWSHVR